MLGRVEPEHILAGIGQRLPQVDAAVGGGPGRRPDMALRREAFVCKVGVKALVLDDKAGIHGTQIHIGDGGDHLIDGAGRIGRLQSAVPKGVILVLCEGIEVFQHGA